MKSRPDVDKYKQNPASFLEAAAGSVADRPAPPKADFHDRPKTEQKGFRLRLDTVAAIEREVYASRKRGQKITQTDLVERALDEFFARL